MQRIKTVVNCCKNCGTQVIGMVLQHGDPLLQNKAVDILLSSVSHDPTTLRSHMLQDNGKALFSQLLQLMIDSSDAGLQEQILEVTPVDCVYPCVDHTCVRIRVSHCPVPRAPLLLISRGIQHP